jgi:hypothetical protein
MKICSKCKISKDYALFSKCKTRKDGYNNECKDCARISNKISYIKNKEKYQERSKIWYCENKEQHLINNKKYGKDNPDVRRKATAKYLKNNSEQYNTYRRKRYATVPQFKLRIILGNRLNEVLKKNKTYKTSNIILLLGCSLDDLKLYLEKQFKSEMNWSNHGLLWEVDHIKPCDEFDLTDIEQQKQCFHYTNLQPLFKMENRQKSNKFI